MRSQYLASSQTGAARTADTNRLSVRPLIASSRSISSGSDEGVTCRRAGQQDEVWIEVLLCGARRTIVFVPIGVGSVVRANVSVVPVYVAGTFFCGGAHGELP